MQQLYTADMELTTADVGIDDEAMCTADSWSAHFNTE